MNNNWLALKYDYVAPYVAPYVASANCLSNHSPYNNK